MPKDNTDSLSHTRWNCKYHIVFAPKFRRQAVYGKIKPSIGKILRTLCEQKKVEILEANACPDHRSHSHAGEHPTELERVAIHGVSEGEKLPDDIRPSCEPEV